MARFRPVVLAVLALCFGSAARVTGGDDNRRTALAGNSTGIDQSGVTLPQLLSEDASPFHITEDILRRYIEVELKLKHWKFHCAHEVEEATTDAMQTLEKQEYRPSDLIIRMDNSNYADMAAVLNQGFRRAVADLVAAWENSRILLVVSLDGQAGFGKEFVEAVHVQITRSDNDIKAVPVGRTLRFVLARARMIPDHTPPFAFDLIHVESK